ncbi:hypothetical protein OIV83_003004 [Microbotryomycetes sp. JL201]|nr:hypothetical protein OIV83_003004 [Microbotryomycetes sp. JL201]
MEGPSIGLQQRISRLTNLQFTVPSDQCPIARPYLPIPHPTLPFLSLTLPPYSDDVQEFTEQAKTLSDPTIAMTLSGPPYPYTIQDAQGWKQFNDDIWTKALEVYESALGKHGEKDDDEQEWREAFPNGAISYIRLAKSEEEQEKGQGEWLGDIGIRRWLYETVPDLEERAKQKAVNDQRRVGDPNLAWCIGYYIKPSYQGQQITTYALKALLHDFMIPALGARDIWCSAYVGNKASRRVQEKAGFELVPDDMWTDIDQARGGGKVQHWVTRYRGGRIAEIEKEVRELPH